ncbi:MAG: 2-deoxy-D-gluconate 3-dehydrogenase [Candidatus Rokuibacteriota bacterium]|nr:MAG: 2-deoxy-D-gluconate 3-dehydrogenase [Candidatus Rokubacteria bacterium]
MTAPPALAGKVAIVTGGSRGLGRSIAIALATAGADVAVAARSKADLEETAGLVERAGRRAIAVPTDVTSYAEVERLIEATRSAFGRLDVLVNNSGVAKVQPLVEWRPDDWRAVVDVNLGGVFNGCRAAAPYFIAQRAGKVINISSMLAAVGLSGYTIYSATKGAIIAFTRTLGVEWARHNVQVNAIAPGWFATDMSAPAFGPENPKVAERLLRDIPARRTGRPDEIGPLAVYLASSASDFMTGQTLFLDGGHTAG